MCLDLVKTICDCRESAGYRDGTTFGEAEMDLLYSICVNPREPMHFFIGDRTSVRYCDGEYVTRVAGGTMHGVRDGVGEAALFWMVQSMVCTSTGSKIYIADMSNYRIRMFDTSTLVVTTLAGNGQTAMKDGIGLEAQIPLR